MFLSLSFFKVFIILNKSIPVDLFYLTLCHLNINSIQ